MKQGVVDEIRSAGGEVYGVTSEPQALASRAQEEWELPFACVGDPHHEVSAAARERGGLDLRVQTDYEFLQRATAWDVSHPRGFFQPGVLALSREGRILYRWRSIPTRANTGGATGRPTPEHVWASVRAALAAPASGDAALDEDPPLDSRRTPFPLFAALLMANGWFLRPRPFSNQGDGKNPLKGIPRAMRRLVVFVALWVAAFAWLPTAGVALALIAYLSIAILGFRSIYTTFADDSA